MEYSLEYDLQFKIKRKSLESVNQLRSLGSSITSLELCMMIEDKLNTIDFKDDIIQKVSFSFIRKDKIKLILSIIAKKKLNKNDLELLREDILKKMNNYFNKHIVHVFLYKNNKNEVYIKVI